MLWFRCQVGWSGLCLGYFSLRPRFSSASTQAHPWQGSEDEVAYVGAAHVHSIGSFLRYLINSKDICPRLCFGSI